MGVADLCNACSDIGRPSKCRPTFREMSPTNVAGVFWCRQMSPIFVGKCEQAVTQSDATAIRVRFDRHATPVRLRCVERGRTEVARDGRIAVVIVKALFTHADLSATNLAFKSAGQNFCRADL